MPCQRTEHGQAVLGDVKVCHNPRPRIEMSDPSLEQVEHVVGGMRGLKAMLWEASVLDPNEV